MQHKHKLGDSVWILYNNHPQRAFVIGISFRSTSRQVNDEWQIGVSVYYDLALEEPTPLTIPQSLMGSPLNEALVHATPDDLVAYIGQQIEQRLEKRRIGQRNY